MRNIPYRLLFALAALALAVACGGGEKAPSGGETAAPAAEQAAAPTVDPATAGAVTGTVTYENGDPDTEISMGADPKCQEMHSEPVFTQTVEATDGKLADVFVYVKEGISGKFDPPAEAVTMHQQGCTYHPHVFGLMVGQKLVIRNDDETLHNVHATPDANTEFNQGQPFQGMELERTFNRQEVMVPFKCDVHPWMSAYMGVLEHPYFAVSGADGTFSIESLPPGTYTLEAWHEKLGTRTQEVTVGQNETVDVSFDFSPAAAAG